MSDEIIRPGMHGYYMQRAIELAGRGWYTTRPNPRVGCVLVRQKVVIGEGWHVRAGQAHAERVALDDSRARGNDPRGATAYVTLEPCSHTGRTPPCCDALIEAGVARVVVGSQDPNPAVDGQGIARLRDAGIDVETGVLGERCAALNPGFNMRMKRGRPRVRVKLAMSIDGRTAAANGQSQWITGEAARDDVHRLRAESGAVMIGSGTLIADDPSLNVRVPGEWQPPLRVVLDTRLQMSADAKMLALDGDTLVLTADTDRERISALEAAGAQVEVLGQGVDGLNLDEVLAILADREVNDVLVEAGQTLAGALLKAELIDEYIIYMAPLLIGRGGRGLVDMADAITLADAQRLVIDAVDPVGPDWRIRARPEYHHSE